MVLLSTSAQEPAGQDTERAISHQIEPITGHIFHTFHPSNYYIQNTQRLECRRTDTNSWARYIVDKPLLVILLGFTSLSYTAFAHKLSFIAPAYSANGSLRLCTTPTPGPTSRLNRIAMHCDKLSIPACLCYRACLAPLYTLVCMSLKILYLMIFDGRLFLCAFHNFPISMSLVEDMRFTVLTLTQTQARLIFRFFPSTILLRSLYPCIHRKCE